MKKFLLLLICLLCFLPAAVAAQLNIIQVTDVHFISDQPEILTDTVKRINEIKDVDLIIFTGDNTDKSNAADLKKFLTIVSKLNRPYYILLGNHDAYKIGGIAKDTYMEYVKKYNKYQPSAQANFTISPAAGIEIVCLDGATPMAPSSHGYFNQKTLTYFDKVLAKNKRNKVLVFQHFPIIPPLDHYQHTVLEVENYWNVINKYDNIVLIASGHYHNAKTTVDDRGIYHISAGSLGKERKFKKIEIIYSKPFLGKVKIKKVNPIDLKI